ncbi:MAG: hypothetical protein ACOYON_09245 [Fimbriimonas sp.]
MKLLLALVSGTTVLLGFVWHKPDLLLFGAMIHLAFNVTDILSAYKEAKCYRESLFVSYSHPNRADMVAESLRGMIALLGIVVMAYSNHRKDWASEVGGAMLWGGSVSCYFLVGQIWKTVGGMPLRMTPGGCWRFDTYSRRRRR